jgi:DNA helicase HerA-like ATPase
MTNRPAKPAPAELFGPDRDLTQRLEADMRLAGQEQEPDPNRVGSIGATMFDLPGSEDNTITVLLSQGQVQSAPSQGLVRIKSRQDGDGRGYLGIVTAGPFAEPDTLRADSHMLVTVATRGGLYLPPFHGRVQVAILGEELADGSLVPPRLRPLPNSPVFHLSDEESAAVLRTEGDIRLGLVVGHKNVVVGIPSEKKLVLPRHLAILGTTGGGKSTTVARLVQQAQAAGMAVILLDVEGEYTHLHEPTDDRHMQEALRERDLQATGVPLEQMKVYHLVGRESANPEHPKLAPFSLQFAQLSPYTAAEILNLTEAQEERFRKAYDLAKEVMRDLGIFPAKNNADQERIAMEIDEFERGYPRLTLSLLIDLAGACLAKAELPPRGSRKKDDDSDSSLAFSFRTAGLQSSEAQRTVRTRLFSMNIPGNPVSWLALLGKLWRLQRLNVFFNESDGVKPLIYSSLLHAGQVSVIDLSDTGSSELNSIVIADLLRGIQSAQDDAYQKFEKSKTTDPNAAPPTRVLIVIEEAHEFLSAERIDKTRILFEQVARIAKRGRKRWLGLVFVTQLPQHLPRQVFGLVNSYVLHKITDPQVVNTLERTVSGIDAGLWKRLSGLAPGQAIVSFPHMTRPLLVAVDPTPAKLRLVD